MKRTLLLYGNCQAEAISVVLDADPAAREHFHIVYLRSFKHPSEGWGELPPQDVAACSILLEQHDPRAFPYRTLLPTDCVTIKFPAIDFNVLWPFNCPNPYDRTDPDVFPYGRFPYGDRVVINLVDEGLDPDVVLETYLTTSQGHMPDLDRLMELEAARLRARDVHCDVKMSAYVLENFRKNRLFWTADHTTSEPLRELLERLAALAAQERPQLTEFDIESTIKYRFSPEGPLGVVSVPVHPRIAEHFGLEWYDPDERHQAYGNARYSYQEYFASMIRWAMDVKASRHTDAASETILMDGARDNG
jgi:hypothetical protein